jgi:hypothetical protein
VSDENKHVTHAEFAQYTQQQDRRNAEIIDSLNELRRMVSRPANYGLLIAALTALGSFILLYTNPISKRADKNTERIEGVLEDRFTDKDGDELKEQITSMREAHSAELISRARWMGNAENDIAEHSRELQGIWDWRHTVVDPAVSRYDERIRALEIELEKVREEQSSRTSRVYGGTP